MLNISWSPSSKTSILTHQANDVDLADAKIEKDGDSGVAPQQEGQQEGKGPDVSCLVVQFDQMELTKRRQGRRLRAKHFPLATIMKGWNKMGIGNTSALWSLEKRIIPNQTLDCGVGVGPPSL